MNIENKGIASAGIVMWLWFSLLMNPAFSHDLKENGPAKWAPNRFGYMPTDHVRNLNVPPGVILPEYVIKLPNRWAIGQDIHICFVGGSDELRNRIIKVAMQWFDHANLHLAVGNSSAQTCATNDRSEIRVGFSEPGYWSYVGNDSLNIYLINNNLSSLNLQGFDSAPPDEPRFTGIVLHEFGHALGLEHEHQSPASGCDNEYDWPKLYAYYQTTYGWNQQMVDNNVRQLMADSSAYAWSQFDPLSIMIYGTDPQFLFLGTKSPCFLHDNNTLSALDILGMETLYPAGNVVPMLQSRVAVLQKAVSTLSTGSLKEQLTNQLEMHKTQLEKLNTSK
ncbi:MAG: hypothetical protein WB870_14375 [Gallionellaceae bacterium]